MEHTLYIAKGADIYDISGFAGNITWGDSIESLGMQLDFSIGSSSEKYFPKFVIEPGDIVFFKSDIEIFRGIIVTKSMNGVVEQTFTAFDFCFYLNKSKIIKQFNSINASKAISQICSELNIKIGSIDAMRSSIKHIYYDKTAADIINDILIQESQETGKQYIMEMQGDSFCVFERSSKPILAEFKPAVNLSPVDVSLAMGSPSRSLSIEEMRNSILIVSGNEKSVRVLATAKDETGIEKYGLLQEIETVDDKEKNKVQNIATTRLQELNKVSDTLSLELLGDDKVRAGRVLILSEEVLEINGNYLITSCNHTLSGGIHTMSLDLKIME